MGEPQPVPVESAPPSRTKVALTVLFHSSCAILSTILSKSALNGIEAPVTLLGLQTAVQVVLFTTFGLFTGWIQLSRPPSVCSYLPCTTRLAIMCTVTHDRTIAQTRTKYTCRQTLT